MILSKFKNIAILKNCLFVVQFGKTNILKIILDIHKCAPSRTKNASIIIIQRRFTESNFAF